MLENLDMFHHHFEKSEKLMGTNPLYELRQVKCVLSNEKKCCMIFRKSEIKPQTLTMVHKMLKLLKSLDHPNIIKVEEAYEDLTKIYFVLEDITGPSLFNYVM